MGQIWILGFVLSLLLFQATVCLRGLMEFFKFFIIELKLINDNVTF